jgi:hypothetical protein
MFKHVNSSRFREPFPFVAPNIHNKYSKVRRTDTGLKQKNLKNGVRSPNLKKQIKYLNATNGIGSLNLYRSNVNNCITNISTHQFVKVQRTVPVCSTKYSQQIFTTNIQKFRHEQLYYKYFNTPIRQGSENRSRL